MTAISGVVITYNEEDRIHKCLDSLEKVVDEIVVVDSFSTDTTKEKVLNWSQAHPHLSLSFLEHEFKGHIEQKNWALSAAQYDYILSLDADESLDSTLIAEILALKQQKDWPQKAYQFHRLTFYKLRPIFHCGWYPDTKLRLFDRREGQWEGMNPHDIVQLRPDVKVSLLKGHLLHDSYPSITSHIEQTNKFTSIAARSCYQQGVRSSWPKILTRPMLKFVKDYILKRGFLDGRYGFIVCVINALSAFLKYTKIKEIQDGKKEL